MSTKIFDMDFEVQGKDINSIESISVLLSPTHGKTQGVVSRLSEIEHIEPSERISVSIVVERNKS